MLPRVTLLVPYGYIGGAEGWALRLIDAWSDERRASLSAVVLGEGPSAAAFGERVPTHVIQVGPGSRDIPRAARLVAKATRDADVVWANGVKAAMVAAVGRPLGGRPTVWVKHDRSHDGWLSRPLGRSLRRVVAVSEPVAAPVRREDVVIIPPPLPASPAHPAAEARRRWLDRAGIEDDVLLAAMVGRLSRYKDVETGIRALVDAPSWHLLVVGDADPGQPGEPERLTQVARSCGVADRVHLVGAVPEAGRDLAGVDVVMVLTGYDEEGFGGEGWSTVALEALWAGTALIGSTDGAPMARTSGGVVPAGRPDDVSALLRGLTDPGRRADAGTRGRRVLDGHPDAARAADMLWSVLEESARMT